ncbi:MAG: hypothetical protein CME06_10815 [Gemmatimonadetes bacterium]|nr:hypothetical protein [Gemmatimonadota bacterium]
MSVRILKFPTPGCIPLSLLLLAIVSGVAPADVIFPVEWGGIWEMDSVNRECESGDLISETATTDTICPGTSIEGIIESGGTIDVTCTGTATGDRIIATCAGSFEVFPGCTAQVDWDFDGTLSGETMVLDQQIVISYEGSCPGLSDTCTDNIVEGERIDTNWNDYCEQTRVQERSWGAMKTGAR